MSPRRPLRLLALAAVAALSLSACATTSDEDTAEGTDGVFPLTIEHAFGETEIPAEPERVVTWGWGSTEAALALGVVPVAIESQPYAGDENGVLPWVLEDLESKGAETPTILTTGGEEPPYEEIEDADPDVILAPYSGITEEQYEILSAIAPSVSELATGESPFYFTLSYEQLDQLESDILISYSDSQAAADTFAAQSYAQAIPAVANGGLVEVVGTQVVSSVSPPTALSLSWSLDDYVALLSEAALAVQ